MRSAAKSNFLKLYFRYEVAILAPPNCAEYNVRYNVQYNNIIKIPGPGYSKLPSLYGTIWHTVPESITVVVIIMIIILLCIARYFV